MDTFTQELADVDRAILDGETEDFVRVHVRKGTDEIVGATVVAAHAGDLIGELTLAMKGKLGLKTIGGTIHPYPTQAEAIRKIGDLLQPHATDAVGEKAHAPLAGLDTVANNRQSTPGSRILHDSGVHRL